MAKSKSPRATADRGRTLAHYTEQVRQVKELAWQEKACALLTRAESFIAGCKSEDVAELLEEIRGLKRGAA